MVWNSFKSFRQVCGVYLEEFERFNSTPARSENLVEVMSFVVKICESMTTDEALSKLRNEDVPCSATTTLEELMEHPQIEANGLFKEISSSNQGQVRALRFPAKFNNQELMNHSPAPALGEHKAEITILEYYYLVKHSVHTVTERLSIREFHFKF